MEQGNSSNEELQYLPDVQLAVGYMVRAAQLEMHAGLLKAKANQILIPVMLIHDVKNLPHKYGVFQHIAPSKSSFLKKDRLKENLVNAGVDSETIADCFLRATDESSRGEYIKFVIKDLPQDRELDLL